MKDLQKQLVKWRRDLHQIPELGFDLFLTHAYLKDKLENFGYEIEIVAKTGIVAVKKGKNNKAIAFRSDMDALPVLEQTNANYQSLKTGKMHACGHDGHMAMLLGFASYMAKKEDLNKTIIFIFQPAEEGPGGAKVIIEEGLFKKYDIESIFGLHMGPDIEEGIFGFKSGPMFAQNAEFDLTIQGTSAHGAQPHLGNDAIVAAGHLITQYQTIAARFIDPLEPTVVTIGTISGGEARNIIANQVKLSGTIRSFHEPSYERIKQKIREIDRAVEQVFGVKIDNDIRDYYPPVINDDALFELVKKSLNASEYRIIKPVMFAEDFAFYQKEAPGFFAFLGSKNVEKGYTHPLHSCYFEFDDQILIRGVEYYIRVSQTAGVF